MVRMQSGYRKVEHPYGKHGDWNPLEDAKWFIDKLHIEIDTCNATGMAGRSAGADEAHRGGRSRGALRPTPGHGRLGPRLGRRAFRPLRRGEGALEHGDLVTGFRQKPRGSYADDPRAENEYFHVLAERRFACRSRVGNIRPLADRPARRCRDTAPPSPLPSSPA